MLKRGSHVTNREGQWGVEHWEYEYPTLPPFVVGGAYVLNNRLIITWSTPSFQEWYGTDHGRCRERDSGESQSGNSSKTFCRLISLGELTFSITCTSWSLDRNHTLKIWRWWNFNNILYRSHNFLSVDRGWVFLLINKKILCGIAWLTRLISAFQSRLTADRSECTTQNGSV